VWTTAYSVINYPAVARETERSTATQSSSPANTKLPVPIAKVPKTPAPEIEAPKAYPSAPVRSNDRNRPRFVLGALPARGSFPVS